MNKPCGGLLVLRTNETQNTYLNIQANGGELISKARKKKQLGTLGPTNLSTQSLAVTFPSNLEYP